MAEEVKGNKTIVCKDCRNRQPTGLCEAIDKHVRRKEGAAQCGLFKVKR